MASNVDRRIRQEEPEPITRLKPNVGGARKIARKLLKDAGINQIPVSLQKVLDYLKPKHDLAVLKFPLEGIDGVLVIIDGRPTIGFNGDKAWVRRRFTIAHEIGHLLMGHTCHGIDLENNSEREASQFAGELLVPLEFVKKDFAANPDLEQLAKKYTVSKEALCRHLMDCRVLKY